LATSVESTSDDGVADEPQAEALDELAAVGYVESEPTSDEPTANRLPDDRTVATPEQRLRPLGPPEVAEPAVAEPTGRAAISVTDPEGNPLAGVSVEMRGPEASRLRVTDGLGQAEFEKLEEGEWELSADLDGFSSVEYPSVDVRQERKTTVDVEMSSAVEEVITVTNESPLLDQRRDQAAQKIGLPPVPTARDPFTGRRKASAQPMAQRAMEVPKTSVAPPSTGGTHEPNDGPYGDVFYREYGVNPFVDTDDDPLSTFGLDVDTGSYTIARRYIEDGYLPPREAIRVEEMINYFDYDDAAPKKGDFAVHAELAPTPFTTNERYRLVRFGIRGREISEEQRKPATLIFVVDVSGSMDRGSRLGLVKASLTLLLSQLREDDLIGLVIYGSWGEVLLDPTSDHDAILSAIGRLRAGGSTNAEEGLTLAYELASRHYREGAINRIILCSDGVANVGATGPDSILARVRTEAERGIELTTVGFGMGNYNDLLMEQLANKGDGNYAYVDDPREAERVFVENLTGTLQTIAADAKVQVEFNPEVVTRYRLLGYENRDIADERFRDDTVDAGEIGAGHSVTALYEVKLATEVGSTRPRRAPLATLHLRYRSKESGRVIETEHALRERDGVEKWKNAPAGLKLAATVAELGELLKGSYWAKDGSFHELLAVAQEISPELAGNEEAAELVGLIARAARLAEQSGRDES
jgi:Ca-activated chloride channel family protein